MLTLLTSEVQNLPVISINIWQIVVSLLNLLILFLIIKKFLFKPVKKMLKDRQDQVDKKYSDADKAMEEADKAKVMWEEKLSSSREQAEKIIKDATTTAERASEAIHLKAVSDAEMIVKQAESDAYLERKKVADDIRAEIVEVSSVMASKLMEKDINDEDHHKLIDSFISEMGEGEDE